MAQITQNHPDISKNPNTFLAAKAAAGATSITVKNWQPFVDDDYVVVGKPGAESTEIRQLTATPTTSSVAVDALLFDHPADTPVTFIKVNQVKIYRSTNGGSSYSLLTTKAIAIDELFTFHDDGSSDATYLYKTTFYNSTSTYETGYSPAIIATGYTPYSLKFMQDRVLEQFPDPEEKYITRDLITHAFQDFQDELVEALLKQQKTNYFTTTNEDSPTSLTSGTAKYNLPDGFISMIRLDVSYDGINYNRAFPIDPGFGQPDDVYNKTRPFYEFIGTQFKLRPTPDSNSGKYKYWANTLPAQLEDPDDELSVYLRAWKRGFTYRALQMAKYKDKKQDEGDMWGKLADRVIKEAVAVLSVRQEDRGQWMELSDPTFLSFDEQFQLF